MALEGCWGEARLLLAQCGGATGLELACYWGADGVLMAAAGLLLGCCWAATPVLERYRWGDLEAVGKTWDRGRAV